MSTVFVTVGTTAFDAFISAVFSDAFAIAMSARGVGHVVVQLGRGDVVPSSEAAVTDGQWVYSKHGIAFDVYRYKKSIQSDLMGAHLVMCHAGMIKF